MDPQEKALKRAQDCIAAFPSVILGSGASLPHGLESMTGLGQHLVETIEPEELETAGWQKFKANIEARQDLEKAMQNAPLTATIVSKIVAATWRLLLEQDKAVLHLVLQNNQYLPLSRLYRCLFMSTHRRLKIVTTNYDCLAEYAANAVGIDTYTGFTSGYVGRIDEGTPIRITKRDRPNKTVDIAKVHGSLDWFSTKDNEVVCAPGLRNLPPEWQPLIVTPGVSKYEKTHLEPFRTVLTRADKALSEASAYMTIGYGFNDEHIQPKLIQGIESGSKRLIVLARTLTPSTKSILESGRVKEYLAIERRLDDSIVYSPEFPAGIAIAKTEFWNLPGFLSWATAF